MTNGIKIDLGAIGAMTTPPSSKPASAPKSNWGKPKPGVFTFYKLNTQGETPAGSKPNYKITKFDSDLNVESSYNMNYMPSANGGYYDCQCPAAKFDCRHKAIMATIEQAKEVNSERFYCFETKVFKKAEEIGK